MRSVERAWMPEPLVRQPLSERQTEVADMIAAGKSNRQIAGALHVSERTVESHIAAIFDRLGVRSRTEVVAVVLGQAARAAVPRGNLPVPLGSYIGRDALCAELDAALAVSRLVTISGTGGIGKTRTAVRVAARSSARFPDGTWFVELAPLTDPALIAATIARVLGHPEPGEGSALGKLCADLREAAALLVLDNCEHLVADVARIADALLRACPRVHLIATSREPLGLRGERVFRLPSLPFPPPDGPRTAADTATFEAVALFVDRAREADHRFGLSDHNATVVSEISRRLDGIPLAIELAAARVKALPVAAIAERLDRRFSLLTGGERTALPRQRTLLALLDWSYDLLDGHEQRLFERLSVFAGGSTLPAATAVLGDGADEPMTLDLLSSLVDKSLLVANLEGTAARYSLLESSREYARRKLVERGDAAAVADRHASTFLSFAEDLEAQWDTITQGAWIARAEPEAANFRAALEWTLEADGDRVVGARLAAALRGFFANFGPSEGRRWVERALSAVDAGTALSIVAKLETANASFLNVAGQHRAALAAADRALAHHRSLGDGLEAAWAAAFGGRALVALGELERGKVLLHEAMTGARAHGNRRLLGNVLSALAFCRSAQGDAPAARVLYREEIELREATGAESDAIYAANNLAEVEFQIGDVAAALRVAQPALARARRLKEPSLLLVLLSNTASYCCFAGELARARELAQENLALAQASQLEMYVACALQHYVALGARAKHCDAEGEPDLRVPRLAARLLGFVDAWLARLDCPRGTTETRERDCALAELRAVLGEETLERLLDVGAMLTADEALGVARAILS